MREKGNKAFKNTHTVCQVSATEINKAGEGTQTVWKGGNDNCPLKQSDQGLSPEQTSIRTFVMIKLDNNTRPNMW